MSNEPSTTTEAHIDTTSVTLAAEANRLAGQRWAGASSAPGISVPVDDWRWEVACWPIDKWLVWRRRATELLPPKAKLADIQAADRRAYEELVAASPPNHTELTIDA